MTHMQTKVGPQDPVLEGAPGNYLNTPKISHAKLQFLERLVRAAYNSFGYRLENKGVLWGFVFIRLGLINLIADQSLRRSIRMQIAQNLMGEGSFKFAAKVWDQLAAADTGADVARFKIVAGALRLLCNDKETGANQLAQGFAHPSCRVRHIVEISSVARADYDWISQNYERFVDPQFWLQESREGSLLPSRLCLLAYLTGAYKPAAAMYGHVFNTNDCSAESVAFAFRSAHWTRLPLAPAQLEGRDIHDVDGTVVYDLILRAQRGLIHPIGEYLGLPISSHLRGLLENENVWTIIEGLRALQSGDSAKALEITADAQAKNASRLALLDARPSITKILISGFGWSGSSAIHDAIRGYKGVFDIPGAGPVPYLNVGADNEPTFIREVAGFGQLRKELGSPKGVSAETLWAFFRVHILGVQPHSYSEYKSACATKNLQGCLGSLYFELIIDLVHGISKALALKLRGEKRKFPAEPFQRYCDLLVKALSKDGDRYALFNNPVRIADMQSLELIGRGISVTVCRDIRDQFADQRKSNALFAQGADVFVRMMERRRRLFGSVVSEILSTQTGLTCTLVQFERFVLEPGYRREVVTQILGQYDSNAESLYFDPSKSAQNIGIHAALLNDVERKILERSPLVFSAHPL